MTELIEKETRIHLYIDFLTLSPGHSNFPTQLRTQVRARKQLLFEILKLKANFQFHKTPGIPGTRSESKQESGSVPNFPRGLDD